MRLIALLFRVVCAALAISVFGANAALADPLSPAPTIVESFDVGSLHVDRYGSGTRPLILIPGLASGPWAWFGTIAHFERSYAIYAVTLAGFDGRPASAEAPSLAAFAKDFDTLLAEHTIVRPIVVGHSLGGTLAIFLGEREARRFAGIVAVDGLPVFPMLADASAQDRGAIAARAADATAGLDPAGELASETRYMATIGTADPALVAPTAKLAATSDPHAIAAWLTLDLTSDLRPALAKIDAPLLEVVPYDASALGSQPSSDTQAQKVAAYRSLLASVHDLHVEAIPNARHFAMLDRPDAFYAVLDAFFATLR